MTKKEIIIVADYSEENLFSLEELCRVSGIPEEFIQELISYEIIEPLQAEENWIFDITHLERVKAARRLQRDLEVNMAGIVIVLDLLDELEELRAKMRILERHYK
ncbi:MAG: hypothetical protein ACD_46C00342G0003 [uncultured bacterium]|nr:MAG: hypothetical protein ACD_46C00342G0003 [uncultured bacterium]